MQVPAGDLLNLINYPSDLRQLKVDELKQVCQELRQYIIDVVSVNGGHFAASLGVVELTVALHYVLDTPYDQLVWDVGHQAYGHKILTGRREVFHTNRVHGGISGFPKRSESIYDTFGVGHFFNFNFCGAGHGCCLAIQRRDRPATRSSYRGRSYDRRFSLRGP